MFRRAARRSRERSVIRGKLAFNSGTFLPLASRRRVSATSEVFGGTGSSSQQRPAMKPSRIGAETEIAFKKPTLVPRLRREPRFWLSMLARGGLLGV